jgi:signal transduction histidine kinase
MSPKRLLPFWSSWRENYALLFAASPWLPILIGVAVFTAALLLSQALLVQEHRQIEQTIAAVAAGVRTEVTGHVDTRILTLRGMAQRWAYAGAPLRDQWEFEAGLTLQRFPGYQGIVCLDPSLQVRWQVAPNFARIQEILQTALSQYAQQVSQTAQNENAVTVLSPVDLGQGNKGFLVLAPLWQAQVFEGFMIGIFAFQDLLETLLKNTAPGYAIAIFNEGEEVYRRGPADGQDETEWAHETTLEPYGVSWQARVWPLPEELHTKRSALPKVTLGAGLAMAALLAWMVALAQTSRRRAQDVVAAYIRLTREMVERQRAEEELRQAHGALELRVQERTTELAQANAELQRENAERRRAEEALARQAKELARSNHELEHFAHVASHDLQEPLRKILAFGDRLQVKCGQDLNAQGLDYLERMQSAATRMQTLIDDLLTFSRLGTRPRPFVPVDLSVVAHTIVSDMEVSIQRVSGTVQIDNLPTIDADPVQMGQLLQNLIGNALKFHRAGAPPVVKVRSAIVHTEEPEGNNTSSSQQCRIWVEDNGIGFDEQYLTQVFQPFQRLVSRDDYEGTGMGLAICQKIVERHGGSITAQSALGKGTTFIITLPMQQPTQETAPWPNGGSQSQS